MKRKWINNLLKRFEARNHRSSDYSTPDTSMKSDSMDDRYFIDFRPDRFSGFADNSSNSPVSEAIKSSRGIQETGELITPTQEKTQLVPVTPKSVVDELERLPTHFSLEGLDQKIVLLEMKRELIRQHHSSKEVKGLILCLQNRKKYDQPSEEAGVTYREFFSRFDTTDEQRIATFLKKHQLVMKEADIFIPELPDDAIHTVTMFTKICEELCEKRPQLFVIANNVQFRTADNKRDPILLAQSPFGFYYYILGAWDEEMLYLPEL